MLKLSEALLIGEKKTEPGVGFLIGGENQLPFDKQCGQETACAWGAVYVGTFGEGDFLDNTEDPEEEMSRKLDQYYRETSRINAQEIGLPGASGWESVNTWIVEMNDERILTRREIALELARVGL